MKTIFPWAVAVLAIAGAAYFFNSNKIKSAQLAELQAGMQEMEMLRTEVAELKNQQVPAAEIAQLRKDKEDLIRLRNEVTQLREEKQQLTRQTQAAQANVQQAQAESRRIQEQAVQALAQTQADSAALVQAANACVNGLRQLDGAKQQWALENQKTADAQPTVEEIAPYLAGGVVPACPAQGRYTLNIVGSHPACSIPGHALPQ